jgi:N-acetylneuraminic acid mutarotase
VLDGRLVSMGGISLFHVPTSVPTYDPRTGQWGSLPDMPVPVHHTAAASDGDETIWVFGGASRFSPPWTPLSDVFVYQQSEGRWSFGPRMPEPRLGHDAVWHEGKLYLMGGDGPSNDVLIFDPVSGEWSRGAPMPSHRHHVSAFVHDGRIYVVGGRETDTHHKKTVEVYDPAQNTWRSAPDFPTWFSGGAILPFDGGIYAVGGEGPAWPETLAVRWATNPDIFQFDRTTETWRKVAEQGTPRHGIGAGIVDGRAYLLFGADRAGLLSPVSASSAVEWFDPDPSTGGEPS